jgi:hypothetical protein
MYKRHIQFSGYEWRVKSSISLTGPGPNFFSHSDDNIWIDRRGRLNIAVNNIGDRWYCAEVVSIDSFGYGRYEFALGSNPVPEDKNIVFGLFTWDDDLQPHHNEIDIEFSSWGASGSNNSQYVIHTGIDELRKKSFSIDGRAAKTLHVITWAPGSLVFESYRGRRPLKGRRIESWTVSGDEVPVPANEQVRMNLWLIGGTPPEGTHDTYRIKVSRFSFTPGNH